MAQRIALSDQLLRELRSVKRQSWQFIVPLEESWFYPVTDHDQICSDSITNRLKGERHTTQDRKILVTIAWNPLWFRLVNALRQGMTFNAEHSRDNMLPGLIPFLPEAGRRKLILLAHHAGRDTAGAKQGLEWVSQNNGNHCPSAKDLLI